MNEIEAEYLRLQQELDEAKLRFVREIVALQARCPHVNRHRVVGWDKDDDEYCLDCRKWNPLRLG